MKSLINGFLNQNKIKKIITVFIIIFLMFCVFTTISKYIPKKVTSASIMKEIETSSELTTAKITYRGLYKYQDQGAVLINRSDFTMLYTAVIRTGFNLDKMDIKVNNLTKKVKVKIPKANVLDVNINEESVEFYDSKFALFNFDVKEDAAKAIGEAKEDAKKNVVNEIDFDFANKQSEVIIRGIIQKTIPKDYEIIVKFKN